MNRDLTEGKPSRVLWQFCLPLFASVIFQQLYNVADSFVAGKFVGEAALAALYCRGRRDSVAIALPESVTSAAAEPSAKRMGTPPDW